jgi:HAD superfamily hydrolase (TIGR01509 family)
VRLANVAGVRPAPWLSPVPVSPEMLSLPAAVRACLFDLDGVLTDSAVLHAWAWGEVFDEFLLRSSEKTGWHFIPFDREIDYRTYIDGRTRLEGIHAFLHSRGIRLPARKQDDAAQTDTADGLAKRKGEVLSRGLHQRGVTALAGARRYLEAAGHAGLGRAVVSASTSTLPMLELAGLATLVEERVDADVILAEGLRSRPAPDLLLAACHRLDVRPEEAVTFTHSAAGVAAGHTAGLTVIGVGDGAQREVLQGFGAERVVPSLSVLLDRQLSGPGNNFSNSSGAATRGRSPQGQGMSSEMPARTAIRVGQGRARPPSTRGLGSARRARRAAAV